MNGRQMTKGDALRVILVEHNRQNREPSQAEFRRLMRAFTALDLTPDEMLDACRHLGIAHATGQTINPDLADLLPWRRKGGVDR
jgi:signal recognition particle subunit SEC65